MTKNNNNIKDSPDTQLKHTIVHCSIASTVLDEFHPFCRDASFYVDESTLC